MKIRRIHTIVAIMSKDHKFSFDIKEHRLEYDKELCMFKIDDTLVPPSNIREILLEGQISPSASVNVKVEVETHPTEEITKPKRKVK